MKTVAVACNVALAAFTVLVLATDGASGEPVYILFTALLLVVPAASALVLSRGGPQRRPGIERAAAAANLLLLGFICWAIVDQYPHPADPGLVEYVALLLFTPVVSIVALVAVHHGKRPRGLGTTTAH